MTSRTLTDTHTATDIRLPGGLTASVLESLNLPLVVTDPQQADNPIVFVSRTFQTIMGYAADEVLGRNCRFLQGPDTCPEATRRMGRAVRAGLSETVDLLNYRKSGEPFINRVLIAPLYDGHGEVTAFIGVQQEVFPAGDPLSARLSRNMAFPRVRADRLADLLEDLGGGEADSTVFAWDIASGGLYSPGAPDPGADLSTTDRTATDPTTTDPTAIDPATTDPTAPETLDPHAPTPYLRARDFLNSLHPDDAEALQSHLAAAFESPNASFDSTVRQSAVPQSDATQSLGDVSDPAWQEVHISGRFVYVGDSATPTLLCVYLPSRAHATTA